MNTGLRRAFWCKKSWSGKHMMRFVKRKPHPLYRCEHCNYQFHPGE